VGRRRRRIVKIVKKKLPTVFSCPSCGEESIRVALSRASHHATIQCAACGLKEEVEASPADQIVDVYCRFTDRFYSQSGGQTPKRESEPTEEAAETVTASEAHEGSTSEDSAAGESEQQQATSGPLEGEHEEPEANSGTA